MDLQQMNEQIRRQSRAANRRLERAGSGQRKALEHYLKKYHTRQNEEGQYRFQQGKAETVQEARARLAELDRFLKGRSSTKRGWASIKAGNIAKARESVNSEYLSNLTDEELATILEETGGESSLAYYAALENVVATKDLKSIDDQMLSQDELLEAISSRESSLNLTLKMLKAREQKIKKLSPGTLEKTAKRYVRRKLKQAAEEVIKTIIEA